MPLTAEEQQRANELDNLLGIFKDALQRDHKRKCDEMDEIIKKFKATSALGDEDIRNMLKRLADAVGTKVATEAAGMYRTKCRASNAQTYSGSASSSATAPSSASSSNDTEDGEVACVGERTVAQRNEEGFANAIVLDEDDGDKLVDVRVLPPKGM